MWLTVIHQALESIRAPAGLSLLFEVGGDIQKIAGNSSCCSEVNMLVLYQCSRGYTSKYEGKIPGPRSLMTALEPWNCDDGMLAHILMSPALRSLH